MALHACILVKLEVGTALAAEMQLKEHSAVGLVELTTGPYDLVVLVQAQDSTALGKIIVNEIQKTSGVRETLTLFILDQVTSINWLAAQSILDPDVKTTKRRK